jgi:carboxymethylenebutenolidase
VGILQPPIRRLKSTVRTAYLTFNRDSREVHHSGFEGTDVLISLKMKVLFLAFALLISSAERGQSTPPLAPQVVEIARGTLHLKAFLWKPPGPGPFPAVLFNHGSGGADATQTAGMRITEAAERLAPVFLKHGYAFLYPFRRGQGLSTDQAPFIQDRLKSEEDAHGDVARQHLHFILLTTEQLDDVAAALAFLKTVPGIDAKRIAIAGHSFGGALTLLSGERDTSVRAEVTFAAAANSWKSSAELRERLLAAVGETSAAIMLVYAANDYDTTPGTALAAELDHLHKPHLLKIYPPIAGSADEAHNFLYLGMPTWEPDVFAFLDEHVKH